MADNRITLIAELNIKDSLTAINKGIERLQNSIEPLQIKAVLDNDSKKAIEEKISNLTKNVKVKPVKITTDDSASNELFTDIINKDIVDNNTLSRARDYLSAIRKEFQILNAQTSSDLPENTIENIIQKIVKLDSQIKVLNSDYKNLNAVPEELQNKYSKLSEIIKDFDFSPDMKIESKEDLTKKIKDYTEIKTLADNIRSLLKVAQIEESNLTKEIASSIKALENLANSKSFRDNKSNEEVQSQITSIEELKRQYLELQEGLADPKSPEALAQVSSKLEELKPEFDKVVKGSKELNSSLKDDDATARFTAKLNNLTNQIETFADANKKAINSTKTMRSGMTFADEWQRMLNLLKSGNLDNNVLQRLTEDFRNFKGEAKSAGLVTSKFFTDMASQLRTVVQRWVSWYAVANYIRAMINEVITLDTAMTNLKKVTDETGESYEKFIDSAKEQSKALHGTTSDVIEQTAEWAKLGYAIEEAQELTSTSMVYAKVGEVDNKTAVSDIVTAMKAYNIEAENAITIVDRFNKLGNEFSVGSKELGEGLNRSASALAVAGNDISQSLALITGGAEITQNARETGDAIKIISLRLRGKVYAFA